MAPPPEEGEEALGSFWPRAVLDDLSSLDLLQLPRRPARRVLVLEAAGGKASDALVARLGELGAETEVRRHAGDRFLLTISHRAQLPEDALEAVTSWLQAAFPQRAASCPAPPQPSGPAPDDERPLVFGAMRPLFGILTPGEASRRVAGRPAILVTNAGCVNRSGPHRTAVRMARHWASLGFDVLRVDLSGIGDSPVAPGATENVTHPAAGLDDLDQAMRALGRDRVVLVGLCSGGDYAFQLGGRDPRVVGAWMLNPRTFCVLDLDAVEGRAASPPSARVSDVPRSLRSMAEKGVDALLVVSIADPGVAYVDAHAGDAMRSLGAVPGFRRVDIEFADHTFTPVVTQRRVSDVLTGHLALRY
jgi:hypothetical protein